MKTLVFVLLLALRIGLETGASAYAAEITAAPGVASTAGTIGHQFTFTVPVRLSNMHPDARQGMVNCFVTRGTIGATIYPMVSPQYLGGGATTFVIPPAGNFSGNVVVPVDVRSPKDPAFATHYGCYLTIANARGEQAHPGDVPSTPPEATARPGWHSMISDAPLP
jgi:hypothetical protein